VISSDFTGG